MTLAPLVVEEVRKRGSEIPVILGGIVPDHDLDALAAVGITTVLTPGSTAEQIATQVATALAARTQA
jgi:methylmalonyl-CoA mutase C-terminal domain/subunit